LSEEIKSHLFAIRTTGGQEKVVMRLLEAKANANKINIQSVLLVDNLKGYVVIEAINPSDAYMAVEGVRHIRGQLRGELEFKDIEGYLIKKSTVSQLAVDNIVEITGGPFKGMKATITRIDVDKEEATVVLLDASYQLPVDNIVEITGGPFKGMKATITRIDVDKEEATVVLLDASYQLPVTVDANYLKLSSES